MIVPVLLDSHPSYLRGARRSDSLLLLPIPGARPLDVLVRAVTAATPRALIVATAFEGDERYERELRTGIPNLDRICAVESLARHVESLDSSDALLLIAPGCYPAESLDLRAFCGSRLETPGAVRHLLAFEAPSMRSKELVQLGHDGRVRRIQRYYAPMTWPFASGVVASLVPVSCLHMLPGAPLGALEELRRALAAHAVPAQDIALDGECFNLNEESGVLALAERQLLEQDARTLHAPTAVIDPAARLVGAVAVGAGARIEAGALVVGPAVVAPGAVVGRDAVVAQSFILPGAKIDERGVVRHRVAHAERPAEGQEQRRHGAHWSGARPAYQAVDPWRRRYLRAKGIAEPVIASLLLVVLSPLMLAILLLVAATSPGPIFYGDVREGADGRRFECWKFRSMRVNAHVMQQALAAQQQMDGPQFKMDRDPRVTPVGRWLRRLNLDELPQLWNVVRGEMSFVGPRPSPFRENQICVPWRNGRLSVRPGITGLWQVCRHDRELGDFHQWIYYDLLYVRNVSPLLDLKIFFGTLLTLGGKWPIPLTVMLGADAEHDASVHVAAAEVESGFEARTRPTPGRGSAVRTG